VLDLVLDATIDTVDADVVSLLLEDPKQEGRFTERMRKVSAARRRRHRGAGAQPRRGAAPLQGGPPAARARQPLVPLPRGAARPRAPPGQLLQHPAQAQGPHHRHAQRLQLHARQQVLEGQRKMLYVLASRAAFSIENARLYENLVDANKDLTRANVSLEENFKQTIIGFAHALEESDRYTRGHSERVAMYARLIAIGLR
jgi:hypothetical protein